MGSHVQIVEVYPNGFHGSGADQFVRLYNPAGSTASLAGWSVGDGKLRAVFPAGAQIGPGQTITVARDSLYFRRIAGAQPDYSWAVQRGRIPLLNGGAGLRFGREKGIVALRDGVGRLVDMLAYGEAPPAGTKGWSGPPVPAPVQGEVINRGRDESTWTATSAGRYVQDSDTAADWKQGREWVDRRVLRPGQTWFGAPTFTAESVTLYASPDNTYETLMAVLARANRSIDLNVYDFSVVPLAERLAEAARRGVKVRLLLEAGSAGRILDQERYMGKLVHEAGGEVRWMVNDPGRGINGRYVFNHAKYGVIDGRVSFVQSENFVRHGLAPNPSYGNRGWGVVVENQPLAAYLSEVFAADWNPSFADSIGYKAGTPFGPPPDDFVPETGSYEGEYKAPFPAVRVRGPVQVTPVLAPDHGLLETMGIIGLMRSAQESIRIEQQYAQVNCA